MSQMFAPTPTQAAAPSGDAELDRGLALLAEGQHAEAAEVLAGLVAEVGPIADRTTPAGIGPTGSGPTGSGEEKKQTVRAMIGAGQALRHLGRYAAALEFFEAAIAHDAAEGSANPLRLAAADCAYRADQGERACEYCDAVIDSADRPQLRLAAQRLWIRATSDRGQVSDAWQRMKMIGEAEAADRSEWAELALAIGLQALADRESKIAAEACQWFLDHAADEADRESAVLGVAWAAAQGAEPHAKAAERLLQFVAEFPASENVPRALLVAAGCLQRSDHPEQATEIYQRLIHEHPHSEQAAAAIAELSASSPERELPAASLAIVRRMFERDGEVAEATILWAILHAAGGTDPQLWELAVEALLETPSGRGTVGQVLASLTDRQQHADAERLAAKILGDVAGDAIEPAFEQACRWAAIHGRWSMLALAAESAQTAASTERLRPLSLRLLAEGLVQVGRGVQARPLLDRLVENHQWADFDLFVRRAEIALAHDDRQRARETVQQAVEAASTAAEQPVADMLQAQMLIRDARMDEARVLLEGIVRQGDAVAGLKSRAQWMIGETHFLQRRFREAVEAYRLVESFDAQGEWTAAALVQAGKAFEQLGRPRDAAICYSGLLRRFGDSTHAAAARDRLAAIGGTRELR